MGKPVEQRSFAPAFFAVAVLIALATAWACYEELAGRRPWKALQDDFRDRVLIPKAERDLEVARAEWRKHPEEVDQLEAAKRRLTDARERDSELQQYWLPDLAEANPPGVDRCGSCHAAIDTCGFTDPRELVEERRAFAAAAGGEPDPDSVARHDALLARKFCVDVERLRTWSAELDQDPKRTQFTGYAVPLVFRTHPHRAELLGETHPPERFGCTLCHGGEGPQTKGIGWSAFRHGLDDPSWPSPLLDLEELDGHRLDSHAFVETACAQCHRRDTELRFAPTLGAARELFSDLGCNGCHDAGDDRRPRRPGPPLTAMRAKLNRAWMESWIANPRAMRPHTRMPNFWPDAIDVGTGQDRVGSAELARRTADVSAIVAYLWATSRIEALPVPPALAEGDARRGHDLVQSRGCLGCHQVEPGDPRRPLPAAPARDVAPELIDIGSKTNPLWLDTWLKDPRAWWPETRMPSFRLTDREAADIAADLAQKREGQERQTGPFESAGEPDSKALQDRVATGKKLISRYGCYGCHEIAGFEQAPKPGTSLADFGRKPVDELDFGKALPDHRQQTWNNWVALKLRRPRAFRGDRIELTMPQYDLDDGEVEKLMVFLKSQRGPAVVPVKYLAEQDPDRAAVIESRRQLHDFNCRGCHLIDGTGGAILDRYRSAPGTAEDITMAPPRLAGEGAKVQPGWAFDYLKHPVTLRPWLEVRMPTFALSDEAANQLVHGFAAASGKAWPSIDVTSPLPEADRLADARQLFQTLQCAQCHLLGRPPPGTDLSTAAPDLYLAQNRLRPEWIAAWIAAPSSIDPNTKMPTYFADGQSPLPDLMGGSAPKQIEALRDLVMHLREALPPGSPGGPTPAPAGSKQGDP